MKKSQRISISIIISAIILLMAFGAAPAQPGDLQDNPIRFAIIGDRTSGHIPGIYGQIVIEIERMKPDFVMTVGDMIEEEPDVLLCTKPDCRPCQETRKNLKERGLRARG